MGLLLITDSLNDVTTVFYQNQEKQNQPLEGFLKTFSTSALKQLKTSVWELIF